MTDSQENGPTYRGGVFSRDLPGGKAGADLLPGTDALGAVTSDGRHFSWLYADCRLEIGGASGRMVFCRSGESDAAAFCEQDGFLEDLVRASGGALDAQAEIAQVKVEATKRGNLHRGLVLLGVCIAVLIGGFYGLGWAADRAIDALPISIDQGIGKAAAPMIEGQGELVTDPLLTEAINDIVAQLLPHVAIDGFEFNVHVVESDVANAFALPGGNIVVFTGLIERSRSPEQVAGVISHEIAHVTLRHGLRRMARGAGSLFALRILLGDAEGLLAMGASMATEASLMGHSRAQESEADREGVRMLLAADIEPRGLAEFFEQLALEETETSELTSWFSTHPDTEERIAAIKDLMAGESSFGHPELERTLGLDWEAIREQARASSQGVAPEETWGGPDNSEN